MEIETAFILLFAVATAVALAARRLRVPYTAALVIAGLLLGGLHWFPAPQLTKSLLFSLLLPGLIFEAAFHIDARQFRANLITILILAVPGVIASTALVAFALAPALTAFAILPGFDWKTGLVFGALISATDPVAVVAPFRNLGAPSDDVARRGESIERRHCDCLFHIELVADRRDCYHRRSARGAGFIDRRSGGGYWHRYWHGGCAADAQSRRPDD